MSVSSLIDVPEVRARLDEVLPSFTKLPALELRVPPRTNRYGLVGTAFDYALRFELQRRNPHAIAREWVAEAALDRIEDAAELASLPKRQGQALRRVGARAFAAAQRFHTKHCSSGSPDFQELAMHTLVLAKLDIVYRAHQLDPSLADADPGDCQDIVDLLAIAPFDALSHRDVMLLNPTFGTFSSVAGGADADLICGDLLLDVKTSRTAAIRREAIRQLLVYVMLARRARLEDRAFPEIRRAGVYLSRQAHLWTFETAQVTSHRRYRKTEDWLIDFAAKTEMDPDLRDLRELDLDSRPSKSVRGSGSRARSSRGTAKGRRLRKAK